MAVTKLLVLLIGMHLAMGFTQLSASYWGGDTVLRDRENPGESTSVAVAWLYATPLDDILPDLSETKAAEREDDGGVLQQVGALLGVANRMGDTINGLAAFDYGVLRQINADQGIVYMVVVIFRIITVVITLALAVALLRLIASTGLLSSTAGLAVVGLGFGLPAVLSALGLAL